MPDPFTVTHFQEFARTLVLDNGRNWELEPFQLEFVADIFAGHREVWLIVPEAQGKTTLLAGLNVYALAHTPDAFIPIAAAARDQIQLLHNKAEGFIRRSGLSVDEGGDFKCLNATREIRHMRHGGRMKVYASDAGTADGVDFFPYAVTDELHRHKSLDLYHTWRGKAKKRGGQIIAISTAGEIASAFENLRMEHRRTAPSIEVNGAHIRAEGNGLVLHDWSVPEGADVSDMAVVKEANPLSAITEQTLAEDFAAPINRLNLSHWERFTCNIASRPEGEGVSPAEWDALADKSAKPKPGTWCIGGIDFARTIDTTALAVLSWESDTRRVIADVRVIEPPVTHTQVAKALVELQRKWNPVGWAYDPAAEASFMVQQLEEGVHPDQGGAEFTFFEHSQGQPMAEACKHLTEAIAQRLLVFDPEAPWSGTLRQHVLNAVIRETTYGDHRFDRPKHAQGEQRSKYPIDALSSLLMAHNVAVRENNKPAPPSELLIAVVGH
jgi:phage terminase large subunit-like protein